MIVKPTLFFLLGPAGVGKDTLLNKLKKKQYSTKQPLVAHRYITKAIKENDENHIEMSVLDFNRRKEAGLFLFDWEYQGGSYAVGKEVLQWLESGQHVIVNGSRPYLATAQALVPDLVPIWMTISEKVLRKRLIIRARETKQERERRLKENHELERFKSDRCVSITNDASMKKTIRQILALIESP
ncbi:MAG: ribose 1,5-bisphosphokinase [Aquificaceae bacterium]|nr:MAG: ribose 1,5-bisphosphokinase [Aquificaceae bacterium]